MNSSVSKRWFNVVTHHPVFCKDRLDTLVRILVCLSLFFLPVSNSLKELILLGALLAIFGNQLPKYFQSVWSYRMNYFSLLLIISLIVRSFFHHDHDDELRNILKYIRVFILPFVLMPLFIEAYWRRIVFNTLIATTLFFAICVCLQTAGWINFVTILNKQADSFLSAIPLSIYVAFTIFVVAHRLLDENRNRILNIVLITFLLYFIFFINIERTGMFVSLSLFFLILIQRLGATGFLVGILLVPAFAGSCYFASPLVKQRSNLALLEVKGFSQAQVTGESSIGVRLTFIEKGLRLVQQRPWFGYGTGAFHDLFASAGVPANAEVLRDPHNIYLHITLQLGIVGLLILVGWLLAQILDASTLPLLERRLAQGLIFVFMVAGNFEDSLLHTRTLIWYVTLLLVLLAAKIPIKKGE